MISPEGQRVVSPAVAASEAAAVGKAAVAEGPAVAAEGAMAGGSAAEAAEAAAAGAAALRGDGIRGDDVRGGSSITRARRVVGLLRVGILAGEVESMLRKAALEGRLIITSAKKASSLPGAAYRLLATDTSAQFSEVLAVLGLSDAVEAGGSRCGICNGDKWQTLRPAQVAPGQVPAAVLSLTLTLILTLTQRRWLRGKCRLPS